MQIYSWGRPRTKKEELDHVIESLSARRGEWALVEKEVGVIYMAGVIDELRSSGAEVMPESVRQGDGSFNLYARMP